MNLIRVYELIQRTVPNFVGIYYRHTNIEVANDLLKLGVNIILTTDTILSGVLTLGFDAISSIVYNIYPENVHEIYDLVLNTKLREATEINDKLYNRIKTILTGTVDWIEVLKHELNKKVDFKVGELRKPRITWNVTKTF